MLPATRSDRTFQDSKAGQKSLPNAWLIGTYVFCLMYGICMSLNIHPMADGMWYWYARLWREGTLLYATLHLPLQPLYILLNALSQTVLGTSWLAALGLPVAQVLVYVSTLLLLTRYLPANPRTRAMIVAGVFLITTGSVFYRFDDYHITSDCLVTIVLYGLLGIANASSNWKVYSYAIAVGTACGLLLTNRLNDGATLVLGSLICTLVLAQTKKTQAGLLLALSCLMSFLCVIALTRDSIASWWLYSVIHAAAAKGGTSSVLKYPLTLPLRLLLAADRWRCGVILLYLALAAFMYERFDANGSSLKCRNKLLSYLSLSCLLAGLAWIVRLGQISAATDLISSAAMPIVLVAIIGLLAGFVRKAIRRKTSEQEPLAILLIIPVGQLLAGALTSALTMPDILPPLGEALLLLPFAVSVPYLRRRCVRYTAAVCFVFTIGDVVGKYELPYDWNFFVSPKLFQDRAWFDSAKIGPAYLEKAQISILHKVCLTINAGSAPRDLLSMPYPNANYFCDSHPWRKVVQTWFDTSTESDLDAIRLDIAKSPPHWIVYQHARAAIIGHDSIFHEGRETAHLRLDDDITHKIKDSTWSIRQYGCPDGADTVLIETVPVDSDQARIFQERYRASGANYCSTPDHFLTDPDSSSNR